MSFDLRDFEKPEKKWLYNPRSAGHDVVFGLNYCRPVRRPIPRTEGVKICRPQQVAEWEQGYDDGLVNAQRYREGYAVGRVNGPDNDPYKDGQHWGWGYYDGRHKFLRNALRPLIWAHQPWDFVLYSVHHPEDDPTGQTDYYPGGDSYKDVTRRDILDGAMATLLDDRWCRKDPVPTTFEDVLKYYEQEDGEWGWSKLLTGKQAKKQKDEKEYEEMEAAAQCFAADCGHKLGTKEFIRALDKAVHKVKERREHWNNPEVRMEEWAACMYTGGGSEVYFDDLNYVNGRFESERRSLDQVWEYLERKFHILMMRYHEAKARRQARKKAANG
jgi:hypothetical protein